MVNKKYSILIGLLALVFIVVLFSDSSSAVYDCFQNDGNETACTTGNASIACSWNSFDSLCNPKGCWDFPSNSSCINASNTGLACQWNDASGFCEQQGCFNFDHTDLNSCVNNTYGLDCQWNNATGGEWCDFSQKTCGNITFEGECFGTNFCTWNGTTCSNPSGNMSFGEDEGTGCFMFNDAAFCGNVTGCSWNGNSCVGVNAGIGCSNINQSDFCNNVPFLGSCCSWNAGSCNATFSTTCWDNIQQPPAGASFCEDYLSITNQTLCNQIAGSPWYMPCEWNNQSTTNPDDDRCGFNGDNFFGGDEGGFEDIGSKSTCESAGGIWKSESYIDENGDSRQDSWCEMAFGVGYESCDSACWACEFQPDGSNWLDSGVAQSVCEASGLGYCSWTNGTNAPDGFGFCSKPNELRTASCGVETSCEDYAFYTNPQASCDADEDCKWNNQSTTNPDDDKCSGINAKSCGESCGACSSETSCVTANNGTSCQWDSNLFLCKNQGNGESSEICFNGIDDDNDNMIDCADSSCLGDSFCGGSIGPNNCGQYNVSACLSSTGGNGSCILSSDPFTNQSWCDEIGTNCWQFDGNQSGCGVNSTDGALGCKWSSNLFGSGGVGLCNVNSSYSGFNGCFSYPNSTSCGLDGNCTWSGQGGFGFCNPKPFSCFESYYGNESSCNADAFCNWTSDSFSQGGGYCDAFCSVKNSTQCGAEPLCESKTGFCEPEGFIGGGCFQFDGNKTGCDSLNKCQYTTDAFANNNLSASEPSGWCNDGFMMTQFQGMESGEPVIIAIDPEGCGEGSGDELIDNQSDICGLGIKEMGNSYGFGIKVDSLDSSAICNGKPLLSGGVGSGSAESGFYLYLDSDDNTTNSCASKDNSSLTGFEFYFKYETTFVSGSASESTLSYRCLNGSWSSVAIGINTWPEKMCGEIGAALLAVDRETLQSYSEFDRSANLRLYGTTYNGVGGESTPVDSVGPDYYVPGTVDFVAEDCKGLVDRDGDGCLPSEDPDCELFNQHGFIPFEDCYNGVDDNFDGNIDCNDPVCKYDIFACPNGGGLVADANDNTPPTLAYSELQAMPDGAMLRIDTFEPSNASVDFYGNVSGCSSVNATIVDSAYKPWHDLPIDNFGFNPQALGYNLSANMSYSYKYRLCDISNNCLVSACANFTTPASYDLCGRNCLTYLDPLDFSPKSGSSTSDPLGNLQVSYDLGGDGSVDYVKNFGDSSSQETLNNVGKTNILLSNPNSTINWSIECINGTIPSSINFNASNLDVNGSAGNGMVGMPTDEYKNKFQSDFGCEKIRLTLPYNGDVLKHCINDSESSCTDVTSSANKTSGSGTTSTGSSVWEIDPELLGFSLFQADTATPSDVVPDVSPSTSPGGGTPPSTVTNDSVNDSVLSNNSNNNVGDIPSTGSNSSKNVTDDGNDGVSGNETGSSVFWIVFSVLVLIVLVVGFILVKFLWKKEE